MRFQIGESVVFLYETGGGVVRKIENGTFYIEDETGFERPFNDSELAKIHGNDYKMPDDDSLEVLEDDSMIEMNHYVRKENRTGYLKPIDVWEIDLHIHELIEDESGLTNTQILSKQISALKNIFSSAKAKHIRKLVVIHGVGEGVLKSEVHSFLSKKEGVEFYDADFREYGKGATAVEIHYNH